MEHFEPNSKKYREEQAANPEERKKLDKIISGEVKTKKKSGIAKFFGNFVSDDITSIKSYIVTDVVIPSVKKALDDTVHAMLWGGGARKGSSSLPKASYRSYYDRSYDEPRNRLDTSSRTGYLHEDIILESRGEAEQVLSQMNDLIDTYGVVSVADLCDLVGITCNYTDNKYGWTNIRNAEVKRIRDGYMLDMPKACPIK